MTNLVDYWPIFVAVLAVVLAAAAAIHAAMTKDDVRAAIGWAGVAVLSPFVGAFVYLVVGISPIRRTAVRKRRQRRGGRRAEGWSRVTPDRIEAAAGAQFTSLRTLGDEVAQPAVHRRQQGHAARRRQ